MIGPLGYATRSLGRRGFHSLLAFLGLTLTVTSTTLLLLLGQDLTSRLGIYSTRTTFGINWLLFAYLAIAAGLIAIVGMLSIYYLVSSMINQRMRDIGVLKAAGSSPRRLFSYAIAEALIVTLSGSLLGGLSAILMYVFWSWPSISLFTRVGPIPDAGAVVLILVPGASFVLSYVIASFRVSRILSVGVLEAISKQLSSLDLRSLGRPLRIRRLGSTFFLASRNVSRDKEFSKTLVCVSICIFLSMIVLSGALVSADTTRSYVVRAMPAHILVVANRAVFDQYVSLGTAFSSASPVPSLDYVNGSYLMSPQLAAGFRGIPGVELVDTRLIMMTSITGFVKAHLVSSDTGENFNNQIIPEMNIGSTQALIVGIDPNNVIGDWYTSDGFLRSSDPQNTVIAGDSLVGNIVEMPFNLSQIGALGARYDVKSALVDPLYAGRVVYAPVQSIQTDLGVSGYNLLLLETTNDPTTFSSISQLASSNGLMVGSQDVILNANLAYLNNTWSYIFIIPVLTLALTCGILLGYLTTNFTRRFNDYVVLRVLGAKAWYSLRVMLWEAWGLLAICMVIAIPLGWLVSIFFLVPDPALSSFDLELSTLVSFASLSTVSVVSALIYSRRLRLTSVKDLKL